MPRARRAPTFDPAAARASSERPFVVQLETRGPTRRQPLSGRVEHLVTGEGRRFGSLAELAGFMSRIQGGAR
jgi:hypothetical protein